MPNIFGDDESSTPPAQTGGSVRDLHKTTDIRFVITELGKLTERIDTLVRLNEKQEGRDDKASDKLEQKFDKVDGRLRKIEDKAMYVAGAIAMLTIVAGLIGFLFHGRLEDIAVAVSKLSK